MSLSSSITVHRFAGLLGSLCSLVAALALVVRPDGWRASGLREVLSVIALLAGTTATLALLASVVGFLGVVAFAPRESGVLRRFVVVLSSGALAAWLSYAGLRPWERPAPLTYLAIGVLVLVAIIVGVRLWTGLARHTGNHQLADDLRVAFIFSFAGGALNVFLSGSHSPPLVVLGAVCALPGAVLVFKTLGALSNQFRYGSAWVS